MALEAIFEALQCGNARVDVLGSGGMRRGCCVGEWVAGRGVDVEDALQIFDGIVEVGSGDPGVMCRRGLGRLAVKRLGQHVGGTGRGNSCVGATGQTDSPFVLRDSARTRPGASVASGCAGAERRGMAGRGVAWVWTP